MKSETIEYANAVEARGSKLLTVGDLKSLIKRAGIPDSVPLVAAGDEECNRVGHMFVVSVELNVGQLVAGVPDGGKMLLFMPNL